MTFKVMKERCSECLYGDKKIVGNRRRSEILRKLDHEDGWFICHKATIAGMEVNCRGDWDQRGGGQLGRIASRLGAVEFVCEEALDREPLE